MTTSTSSESYLKAQQTGCTVCINRWTGSNTNPNNNDGQGRAGTDRSNIVPLRDQVYPEGTPGAAVPVDEKFGHWGNSYPAHLDANTTSFLGFERSLRQNLAVLDNGK